MATATKKQLEVEGTNVLQRNYNSTARIVANQGGTGSSKTYSIAQLLIIKCLEETGKTYSIVRRSMPTLRATAMRDFLQLLVQYGLYSEDDHNKTENTYNLNGNTIEFFGLDEPFKVRSRRRDVLWMNEANEFDKEHYRQLSMRTGEQIFLDYNPSEQFSWLYDEVLERDDCELIVSTYKDNPFLPDEIIREIEGYQDVDENYWRVYGLGERGVAQTTIYTHWQLCDGLPDAGTTIYGLDFGYNNPTALVKVVVYDQDVYAEERIYRRYMTESEVVESVKEDCGTTNEVFCDSEDPRLIEVLQEAGVFAIGAEKGKGSVLSGIRELQKRKLYITKDSPNLLQEIKMYSWKEKNGEILDEPVKLNDHLLDGLRYCVYTYTKEGEGSFEITKLT